MLFFAQSSVRRNRIHQCVGKVTAWCGLLAIAVSAPGWVSSQSNTHISLDQQEIIQFLNKTINWHQNMAIERQMATTPGDVVFANLDRPVPDQVLRLSFDFARAAAQFVKSELGSEPNSPASLDSRYQSLAQAASKLEDQTNRTRADLEALRQKLPTVKPRQRKAVESAIAETESELALMQARGDALRSMLQFMGGAAAPVAGGLESQLEALERSFPNAVAGGNQRNASPSSNAENSTRVVASARGPAPAGIWGILRELFDISGRIRTIRDSILQTDELADSVKQLQTPLVNQLKEMVRQSETIMKQPDFQDPAALAQQKSTLDVSTAQFKLVAGAALPLSKEAILLEVYRKYLVDWQNATKSEYSASMRSLLIRLLGLGLVLGLVLGAFPLWRRAIFRYIQDPRRRYQFLLVRSVALWSVIALIIAFAFASELESVATFAGLITAGVAVALQNVILAVVGYFLLIGKFGVRVGDRVQVSGVSGQVVEIGLIRMHVMELAGSGPDAQPTGRLVAFSNSVVFQPNAGLFRQVPGTNFMWHELRLTLVAESDYRSVEQRVRAAVDVAFKDYLQEFERQRRKIELNLGSVSIKPLAPRVHFQLTPAGLEVLLRFPVESRKATEMDERVTRELLRAIDQEPKLKVVGAEIPTIKITTDASLAGANPT
jgi:small-conductance mechanosensitive channel